MPDTVEKKLGRISLGWLAETREHMQPLRDRATQLRQEADGLDNQAGAREAGVLDAIVAEIIEGAPELRGSKVSLVRGPEGNPAAIRFLPPESKTGEAP